MTDRRHALAPVGAVLLLCCTLTGCAAVQPQPAPAGTAPADGSAAPSVTAGMPVATPSASASPGAASPSVASPSAAASDPAAAAGCVDGTALPKGARTVRTVDLDGDGRADTLFLTTGAPYRFGVQTAAGGVYVVADAFEAAGPHHLWAVIDDGFPHRALVLDDGVSAYPYQFDGCRITQLQDTAGAPLYVPIGARSASNDATTGFTCNDRNGGTLLESVQLRERSDGRWDIAWATLEPSGTLLRAEFADFELRATGLAAGDPRVARARTSACPAAATVSVTHPETGHPNGGK